VILYIKEWEMSIYFKKVFQKVFQKRTDSPFVLLTVERNEVLCYNMERGKKSREVGSYLLFCIR